MDPGLPRGEELIFKGEGGRGWGGEGGSDTSLNSMPRTNKCWKNYQKLQRLISTNQIRDQMKLISLQIEKLRIIQYIKSIATFYINDINMKISHFG